MRQLIFSLLIAVGAVIYLKSALQEPATKGASAPQLEPRQIQIHGKWYEYRADNRYLIDGVPTFYIPGSLEIQSHSEKEAQPKKMRMLEPMDPHIWKVYTPSGFLALKENLEAAKEFQVEHYRSLNELATQDQ